MHVERVEAHPIRIRASEKLKGGTFSYEYYQTVLVSATCDGVEGWGEAMTRISPAGTALLVGSIAERIVGNDYTNPKAAWDAIWRDLRVRGHTRGSDVEALSGIEMALFDCEARLARKPLARILSENPADMVPVFAGSFFGSRGKLEPQVETAIEAGLRGAKVKIGFGVDTDREVLRKVRRAWPGGMLVADANCAYGVREAEKACTAFDDLDLAWFEEPLMSDDWSGYVRLGRQKKVPIGAGESWFPGDLRAALDAGLVDVVEPSVSRCGGIWVEFVTGRDARKRRMKFSPMTGMNSAVSLAASLHVAAAVPTVAVEYNPFGNPLQSELASGVPRPSAGSISLPEGDGIGIEVDRRFVKRNETKCSN